MLVLTRASGEKVLIRTSDGDIWITVKTHGALLRVGIAAPAACEIVREELVPPHQRLATTRKNG